MDAAAAPITSRHPTTPQNKPRRPRCINCPCQNDFQSDESITSAIQSEPRTTSLIDWLSGKSLPSAANNCTNRLRASIVILNAIRDACSVHLEASTNERPSKSEAYVNKKQQQQTIWEDSFPALSSAASTVTPTILFGRKKESESVVKDQSNVQINPKSSNKSDPDKSPGKILHQNQQPVITPKVKKKIKPVTISSLNTSASSAWGNISDSTVADSVWGNSAFQLTSNGAARGNIASLRSEAINTQPISVFKSSLDAVQQAASCSKSLEISNGEKTPSKNKPQLDTRESKEQLIRLVHIYATILKNQLAPYLLLELHLLLRLVSITDNIDSKNSDTSATPYDLVFNSTQSCRDFGSKTMSSIEPILLNLGHDTLKMLASLDSLRNHCPELTSKMQQIVESNNSTLILESGEKALGANANTPHITLPFDHARDSRHNYRSAENHRMFKEREELRDVFLFQLRAFQDVRGRLMEEDISSKILGNIEVESRRIVQGLAVGNIGWFVNFFCDLLLQIGLVPIGETDSDVLKQVADQKRLQVSIHFKLYMFVKRTV